VKTDRIPIPQMVGPQVQGYRFSDTETSSDSILCRTHHRCSAAIRMGRQRQSGWELRRRGARM